MNYVKYINKNMPRVWDDVHKTGLVSGRFTKNEEQALNAALEDYRIRKELHIDEFYSWLTKPKSAHKEGFWPKIAEVLPHRSVRSVKNFCQRRFNPNNYKGKWTREQEMELREYVQSLGYRWSAIGDLMGRTEFNIRDKWKELEHRSKDDQSDNWTFKKTLELVQKVEQQAKRNILCWDTSMEEEFEVELERMTKTHPKQNQKILSSLVCKAILTKHITGTVEEVAAIKVKNWKVIASEFHPPICINECRNRWFLLFKYQIKQRRSIKLRIVLQVIDNLKEAITIDKNPKSLDYYKSVPEFAGFEEIIDFLAQYNTQNMDLVSFLNQMKVQLSSKPIYKLSKAKSNN